MPRRGRDLDQLVAILEKSLSGQGVEVKSPGFLTDKDTVTVRVSLWKPVREAWLTNLNEETPVALPVEGGAVRVTLGPKKIGTVLITF